MKPMLAIDPSQSMLAFMKIAEFSNISSSFGETFVTGSDKRFKLLVSNLY